ncbi:hypothetical protein F8568_011615 [Actinomadura sp. LD22]|uniref:Uncharacterized protein n=1 Tax=Actinomadura physcomitrii TaxID=2650748 RepID=A0A6I4M4L6_9ACTN|nr:hypothetical protein [Actinomadura physcomitrii]MWA01018.1 hypothetical protein [Actinomadura physcomitrii]
MNAVRYWAVSAAYGAYRIATTSASASRSVAMPTSRDIAAWYSHVGSPKCDIQ